MIGAVADAAVAPVGVIRSTRGVASDGSFVSQRAIAARLGSWKTGTSAASDAGRRGLGRV